MEAAARRVGAVNEARPHEEGGEEGSARAEVRADREGGEVAQQAERQQDCDAEAREGALGRRVGRVVRAAAWSEGGGSQRSVWPRRVGMATPKVEVSTIHGLDLHRSGGAPQSDAIDERESPMMMAYDSAPTTLRRRGAKRPRVSDGKGCASWACVVPRVG